MKRILSLILVAMATIALLRCTDDQEPSLTKESIQFSFNIAVDNSSTGKLQSSFLPEGTVLQISLKDVSGKSIFSNQTVGITKMGNSYITEPLELSVGKYFVTDFLIVKESEVLYATPKQHSPLANLVDHPLPYSFNVGKNKVSNVAMQVVAVSDHAPEAFGYASFNIEIINPLLVSVFIPEENEFLFTEAMAYIIKGADTSSTYDLSAKVNSINFKGDENETYKLIVLKDGYDAYEQEFIFKGLKEELAGRPLNIILKPILELIITSEEEDGHGYSITLEGEGNIKIEWPDGTIEEHTMPVELFRDFEPGTNQVVKIRGDLNKVTTFRAFGYVTGITQINGLQHLKELRAFAPGAPYFNDQLDLSSNSKLEYLDLYHLNLPEWFVLPERHNIHTIVVTLGDRTITSHEIDLLINNIYANVIDRNIREGKIGISISADPASASALNKIQILVEQYGWEVDLNY